MKDFLKRLFCKHDYVWHVEKPNGFACLSGETRVLACCKCGKVKKNSEYMAYYEGNGYR